MRWHPTKNIAGLTVGYLTAIRPVRQYVTANGFNTKEWVWLFRCKCGTERELRIGQVGNSKKQTKSCGCKKFESKNVASVNGSWVGEKVGYTGLHDYVRRILPKPSMCQKCNAKPPHDLANKGIYNRDVNNWEWLCRKCHMVSDGRLKKFIDLRKKHHPERADEILTRTNKGAN